jgi:hypothetical protein
MEFHHRLVKLVTTELTLIKDSYLQLSLPFCTNHRFLSILNSIFVDHGLPEMGSAYTGRTGNAIVGAVSGTQLPGFHQFAIFIKELVQFFEVLHSHC